MIRSFFESERATTAIRAHGHSFLKSSESKSLIGQSLKRVKDWIPNPAYNSNFHVASFFYMISEVT